MGKRKLLLWEAHQKMTAWGGEPEKNWVQASSENGGGEKIESTTANCDYREGENSKGTLVGRDRAA